MGLYAMQIILPPTVDPTKFSEWCVSFRIDAKLVSSSSGGVLVGYIATTGDEDSKLTIELKWGTNIKASLAGKSLSAYPLHSFEPWLNLGKQAHPQSWKVDPVNLDTDKVLYT